MSKINKKEEQKGQMGVSRQNIDSKESNRKKVGKGLERLHEARIA